MVVWPRLRDRQPRRPTRSAEPKCSGLQLAVAATAILALLMLAVFLAVEQLT
jgi:hypothetical protein